MAENTMESVSANVMELPKPKAKPGLKTRIYLTGANATPDYETAVEILSNGAYSSIQPEKRHAVRKAIEYGTDKMIIDREKDFNAYKSKSTENVFRYHGRDVSQMDENDMIEVAGMDAKAIKMSDQEYSLFMAKAEKMSVYTTLSSADALISCKDKFNETIKK